MAISGQPPQQKLGRTDSSARGDPIAWQPVATDGGWGWMVVLGSFLIHVFADGIVYSFGVMVAELLDTFGESAAYTSWIISLLTGLTLGTGPIASAVTNRYGCRFTTMLGSLVATAGCLASFFATSVFYLMISVGLVTGLGFGLMYCPAIVVVTMYFEEYRAFATGIAVCGAGIGTFIFSPLTAYIIRVYTWRGAFLIYAGIVLNCAVCGALFRPLEFVPIYADDLEAEEERAYEEALLMKPRLSITAAAATPDSDGTRTREPTKSSQDLLQDVRSSQLPTPHSEERRVGKVSLSASPDDLRAQWTKTHLTMPNGDTVSIEPVSDSGASQQLAAVTELRGSFSHQEVGQREEQTEGPSSDEENAVDGLRAKLYRATSVQAHHCDTGAGGLAQADFRRRRNRGNTVSESGGYLNIKDVFYSGSVTRIPDFVQHHDMYRSISSLHAHHHHHPPTLSSADAAAPAVPPVVDTGARLPAVLSDDTESESGWQEAWGIIKSMIDVSLLIDPVFLLFAISNFLTSLGFNAPLVFLPARAEYQLGLSRDDGSYSLAGFGIANTIGRVIIGYVSDKEWPCRFAKNTALNRIWLYCLSITLCGGCTMLSFLCTDLPSLVIYSAVYGFTLSSYICLTSVILVDLLGLDKLTNAFGLLLLFQGLATLVGPPIAGFIVDTTNNYDYAFIFAGLALMVSGVMLYVVPTIQKRRRDKLPQRTLGRLSVTN